MKTLTLFLILLAVSTICSGQKPIYKVPEVQKFEHERSFQKVKYPDSSYWYGKQIAYPNGYISSGGYNGYTGVTYTFNPVKTKLTLSGTGVVTINIDEFRVTDTIWIQAGKRKVGVPVYKFLDYFKDEPTLTSPRWQNGGSIFLNRGNVHVIDTTRYLPSTIGTSLNNSLIK